MDPKALATQIIKTLTRAGHTAYFAGGWVRDFLMGNPSSDIDIATSAPLEEINQLFDRTIQVGAAFGVVIVSSGGHSFEVATFRRDMEYSDGRRPDAVIQASAEEDALRRDFTINGLFYDPLKERLYDFVGGKEDIKKRRIRTIGDPEERFAEDRLRMLRAVRFSNRFGFAIERATKEAIKRRASTLFPAVAVERVWQELQKMAEKGDFGRALIDLHGVQLLQAIFPPLSSTDRKELEERIAPFSRYPEETPAILYLTALFPGATLDEQLAICRYLRTSGRAMKWVEALERSKAVISAQDPVAWAHLFADSHSETCLQIIAATHADPNFLHTVHDHRHRLRHHIDRIVEKEPLISAAHLKAEGIAPGIQMGELLQEAERLAVTCNLHDPSAVLKKLKASPLWPP